MKAFRRLNPLNTFSTHSCRGAYRSIYLGCVALSSKSSHDSKIPTLSEVLQARIEVRGPITVADYMRAVLTSPGGGYYMSRDVFGKEGDFVTSPEISQLFGEMIGVWFVNELKKFRISTPIQFIELGPGRGTLMRDLLRVFSSLHSTEDLSIHMVEISPELSKIQAKTLCPETSVEIIERNILDRSQRRSRTFSDNPNKTTALHENGGMQQTSSGMSTITVRRPPGVDKKDGSDASNFYYMKGVTHQGLPIYWYRSLLDVPRAFSCILAHEFFDALPVHRFQLTKDGWREILIVPDTEAGKENFKYVIARSETPASKLLMKDDTAGEQAEVCLEGALIMSQLGKRVEEDGGIALIADYGHEGENTDTFRVRWQGPPRNVFGSVA